MNIKATLQKGSVIAALSLSLSAFAAVPANDVLAAGNSNPHAQKLVDSLKALNIAEVDYLYAYLQSITLSDAEYKGILDNTQRVSQILKGAANPQDLPTASKVEVGRLFLESVKLAHLQASIVDENGNPIDISTYKVDGTNLLIQLKDLKGNLLATVNPTRADLNIAALQSKMNALKSAVQAKKQLDKAGTFVPMPNAPLPNTDSNTVDYMALGGLLILLGGIAIVPAVRNVRKSEIEA
ncbi:cell wall anchor protein [Neobacillus sp. 179-J 1A1 HS]|uniref:cell wall anchor protein n=1 Tax=Neobacillus driksii TaxID=3035913 RepID=UPI0035BBFCE7